MMDFNSCRLPLPETYTLTIPANQVNISDSDKWMVTPFTELPYPRLEVPVTNMPTTIWASTLPEPISLKKAIFNDPATIVIWSDGSKTVVKVHDEPYNPEKGLAMCFAKKVLGEAFHRTFREWCGEVKCDG